MNRMAMVCFILMLGCMLFAFPVQAQDHSGHKGHEKTVFGALPDNLTDVRYQVCPVMGGEPLENVAAIHEGMVYHFCCEGCLEPFRKDPKSVIAKIKDARKVPLDITNKDGKCPVTGDLALADLFLIRGHAITFYCCAGCVGKDQLDLKNLPDPENSGK